MSTPAQVRDAIKTKIASVANVGNVYDYLRFSDNKGEIKNIFYNTTEKRVLAWMINRAGFQRRELSLGEYQRLDRWSIIGFMGLDDVAVTGNLFDALVENVSQSFISDPTLGGVITHIADGESSRSPYGLQCESIEPVMMAGWLCHRATCSLITDTTELV